MELPFAVGDAISNRTLYTTFKCACEGGIRYSSAYQVLVLVSNFVDARRTGGEWKDGLLYYTGAGRTGDQNPDRGANKRLRDCLREGAPIYYFEVFRQGEYLYKGRLRAAGEPFLRTEPGADGIARRAVIFPMRLAEG